MASLKQRWRALRPGVLAFPIWAIVRALSSTLRIRVVDEHKIPAAPVIFAAWHGRSLIFANHNRGRGYVVMVSHSNDGEMQTRIFTRFGFRVIRGSTGRGGVKALVEAIRLLREGGSMAMTPDGPRGPSGILNEGILAMAQKSGAAIVPIGIAACPCKRLPTWDSYMVPLPFARAVIVYGDPLRVPEKCSPEEFEAKRLEVQEALHAIERHAESLAAR